MILPRVAIIVIQRERFSLTELSLKSVLAERERYPFELIYVDGNSPPQVQQYLQAQADRHEFMTVIRHDRYLRANEARNLALPLVQAADYILFIDNDVIVERGWLKPLIDCAEVEQAAIVAPLTLQGNPESPDVEIHVLSIQTQFHPRRRGKRWFEQKQLLYGTKLRHVNQSFQRSQVDSVEFHCMMVRRSFLDTVVLEDVFDSLASHTDLCLQAEAAGEKIFLEPKSRVVFMVPTLVPHFEATDLDFYCFKWDEREIRAVFKRFQQKWNIEGNDPSFWSIWNWVIRNRQLPIKGSTAAGSPARKLLERCQSRWCPGWLRMTIEQGLLIRYFPPTGLQSDLNWQMQFPLTFLGSPQKTIMDASCALEVRSQNNGSPPASRDIILQ